jgi:hypothetical protein
VKKELRPVHDVVSCDVCGRTILKGERTELYLAPGGQRHQVCDLCNRRAEHHGWIRESAAGGMPARAPRAEPRRGMIGRLRRRRSAEAAAPPPAEETGAAEREAGQSAANGAEPAAIEPEPAPTPPRERPRPRPKDPRHVRAVPTTAAAKVERALELFNGSDHQRTVGGLARTLGRPWVSALPDPSQPREVCVVVAWELSWYRYRIDLGDEADPVMMLDKGEEIEQIDESLRDWNAALDDEGRVVVGQAASDGSPQASDSETSDQAPPA